MLFVLQFQFNLLSVSALITSSQLTIAFFPDHFIIQDVQNKRMIGKGNKIGDLYVFSAQNHNADLFTSSSVISVNNVADHVWHYRLGHLSNQRLDTLKDKMNCNISKFHNNNPYYICPLAKKQKLSFFFS